MKVDSSAGTATRYGLDGPGIESRWGGDFPRTSTPALGAQPASYKMGTVYLSWGLSGRAVELTTHPHLAPRLEKDYS